MKKRQLSVMLSLLSLAAVAVALGIFKPRPKQGQLSPVVHVDIIRYQGKWYEIAKLPNRFEKQCQKNAFTTYRLLERGKLEVINQCERRSGRTASLKGVARVVDLTSNAKWSVTFATALGLRKFTKDLWILGIGDHYHYAVIGTPDKQYARILSRSKTLTEKERRDAFAILERNGYDPASLVFTPQD